MGRVDEALRRAAEADDPPAGATSTSGVIDTAFPAELPAADEAHADVLPAEMPAAPGLAFDNDLNPNADLPLGTVTGPTGEAAAAANVASMSTKLVGDERMLTSSREQYRRLAATLHHIQATSGLKVVLIASAVAGEGKTLTAANLALTFSESYEREVLLIDADLRRPSLARTFNIPASPGLSDGLTRGFEGKLPLQQVSPRLSVLPAGPATPDPMAGLTSARMRQLITEARAAFDWVIIDTPPIGLMTDASLLSAIADGTVLVVKANSTPYDLVQRAVDALGPGHLLGAVLNRATAASHSDKYYDYYHYAPTPEPPTA